MQKRLTDFIKEQERIDIRVIEVYAKDCLGDPEFTPKEVNEFLESKFGVVLDLARLNEIDNLRISSDELAWRNGLYMDGWDGMAQIYSDVREYCRKQQRPYFVSMTRPMLTWCYDNPDGSYIEWVDRETNEIVYAERLR